MSKRRSQPQNGFCCSLCWKMFLLSCKAETAFFGRLLSDAGVDVDALREKISNFFSVQNKFGKNALDSLKQFWSEHGDNVLAVLQWLWQGCVDLTADIVTLGGHLFDLWASYHWISDRRLDTVSSRLQRAVARFSRYFERHWTSSFW